MPYRDKEKQREAVKEAVARHRKGITSEGITQSPDVILSPEWAHVVEYIKRPSPRMPNLERLQRIAGALGQHADEVHFGDLTLKEIGEVIGVLPPLYGHK